MGITIFKIFIWGGISSDIRSKIMFYASACASPKKLNWTLCMRQYTSLNENFEYSYSPIVCMKIAIIFLCINLNICFGFSKEPSH